MVTSPCTRAFLKPASTPISNTSPPQFVPPDRSAERRSSLVGLSVCDCSRFFTGEPEGSSELFSPENLRRLGSVGLRDASSSAPPQLPRSHVWTGSPLPFITIIQAFCELEPGFCDGCCAGPFVDVDDGFCACSVPPKYGCCT